MFDIRSRPPASLRPRKANSPVQCCRRRITQIKPSPSQFQGNRVHTLCFCTQPFPGPQVTSIRSCDTQLRTGLQLKALLSRQAPSIRGYATLLAIQAPIRIHAQINQQVRVAVASKYLRLLIDERDMELTAHWQRSIRHQTCTYFDKTFHHAFPSGDRAACLFT